MKKFRKLLILSFVLTLLLGNLTVRVSAEDTTVPSQDETTVTTTDYGAEDEAEKRAREQQEALNAAVEEARRKAAEQTQQYQQEIDTQTYQSNDNVWQAIDEKIEPEDGRKKITTTTNSESVKKEDTDKEETVTEKAVKKEVAANVDLGGGSSIAVTTKYGSLSDNTVLSVTELGDSALIEFADRVGLANVVDGRYFVVNLLDENGESVTASRPLTVSLNSVDVNGELVNIYAANSETYELYVEGLTNTGLVDYTFETKDYDTFVILATGTAVEETTEPEATGLGSLLQNIPFLALFNKTEETETGLSGRTETSFTNDFVLNETEVETEGYPAFKATKTISGTSMEVVVDAPAGAFPEGIQLYAEVVTTPQEVLQAIKDETGAEAEQTLTLDIHFYLDNPEEEIEPNVPISVTFNNIAVESETVDVYHETEKIDTVNTDSATLELDGFSNYTFVLKAGGPLLANGDPTNDSTGDSVAEDKRVNIFVNFKWDDDNNKEEKRAPLSFTLVGSVPGKNYTTRPININVDENEQSWDLKSKNNKGALVYLDGQQIEWTLTLNGENIEGYQLDLPVTPDVDDEGNVTFNVTNTYILATLKFNIKFVWDDDSNRDGVRENTKINLKGLGSNGRVASNADLNVSKDQEQGTIERKRNKYDRGTEIEWTLTPEELTGYTAVVKGPVVNEETGTIDYTVTYTHELEKLKLTVEKIWDDDDDRDGYRPDSVAVSILANDTPINQQLTLDENNSWKDTIELLRFENGQKIEYRVEEEQVEKYELPTYNKTEVDPSADNPVGTVAIEITNKHEPERVTFNVTKVWEGENGNKDKRPTELVISAYADGKLVRKQGFDPTKDKHTRTFSENPSKPELAFYKYKNHGEPVEYTVAEADVPYYFSEVTGNVDEGFTVTNKLIPNTTSLTVKKVWEDEDNAYTTRPGTVHVAVRNNGVTVKEVDLTEQDKWTYTFTDLPVYADVNDPNSIIDYRVDETNIDYYKPLVEKSGNPVDGYVYTITNARQDIDLYSVDINVAINWIDDNNRDGLREGVTVRLLKDGQPATDEQGKEITLVLNEENEYSGVFAGMPKYHPAGNTGSIFSRNKFFALPGAGDEITYTIEVVDGPTDGYTGPTVSGNATDGFKIEYTHEPEIIDSISVTKVWEDAENQDGKRPETVYLRLYKADGTYAGKQKAVSETNSWTTTFNSSETTPIYKYENGEVIEYTVVESSSRGSTEPVPVEGYEMTVEGDAATGFTVTNTHKPETVDITVTKVWDDEDDADGLRPTELYIGVYADGNRVRQRAISGSTGWTTTITAETQYKYKPGEVGQEIVYEVKESWARGTETLIDPDGNYELVSTEGSVEEGFTITNRHVPEKVNIKAVKVWMDEDEESTTGGNNRDGIRPSEITFLVFKDGVEVDRVTLPVEDGLPTVHEYEDNKYRDGGIEINYTVVEEYVDNYVTTYETETIPAEETEDNIETQLWTVTNTYDPERRTITVIKNWDDNNDQDGKRPDLITVNLLADGQPALDVEGNPATYDLTAANGWAHNFVVWVNQNDGTAVQPIKYTVEELDVPEYQDPIYSDFADTGYITITNKRKPDTMIVELTKIWDDGDNLDGSRPESIIFNVESFVIALEETGARVHIPYDQSIIMMQDSMDNPNVWRKSIELEKYYDGQPIIYLFTEEAVEGYKSEPAVVTIMAEDSDAFKEVTITNTHEPEPVVIEGNVIWNDSNDQDGKRPDSVTVNLYADGEKIDSKTVTGDSNTWPYTFENLPKYSRGEVINYTVSESPIDDYSMRVQGYDITNSYTPGKTFLTVIKLWDDDRDRDGYRPDNCIVRLLADGEEVNRASLSEGQGWFTVFSDLPKMKDGKEITYTVEEDKIPEYKTEITGDQKEGYVIKNSHTPEKVSVTLRAKWIDDNDKLCKRPDQVKAFLMANGYPIDARILNEKNEWMATIDNLPKYAYGKPIQYTISEQPFKHYEISNIGMTAYNKLENCCNLCSGSECKPIIPKTGIDATTAFHNPNYLLLAK